MKNFTFNLKKIRKSKNLTQNELANLTNLDQRIISRYEKNINLPTIETLVNIAKALEVSLDDLIEIKEQHHEYSKEKELL